MSQTIVSQKTLMQKVLDVVEKVGNKVPHPVIIFLVLIAIVMVLSHAFYLMGTTASAEIISTEGQLTTETSLEGYPYSEALSKPHKPEIRTIKVNSLLTADGIRFMYVSLIPSFMSFTG